MEVKNRESHTFRNISHLFSYLSDEFTSIDKPFNIFIVLPDSNVTIDSVQDIANKKGIYFEIKEKGEKIYTIWLGIRKKQLEAHIIQLKEFWLLLTFDDSQKARQSVKSFIRHTSSLISLGYVPSRRLLDFLNELRKNYDITLHESFIRTEKETMRKWTKSHKKLSDNMVKRMKNIEGKWVAITFKAHIDGFEKFHCRIYEDGNITFYSGDFRDFYSTILLPYSVVCKDISSTLSNRERKSWNSEILLYPISLQLKRCLNRSDLESLSNKLLKRYSGGAFFMGNPLLMMTIIDNNNGSSFDLYAKEKNIEIVPLAKSTSASLSNLIQTITDILPDAATTNFS
ncbi:MAG: hypothetical protein FE046_02480 [Thermoplasmata archaeon]|nr:MAG: hypothetical protein FE046_02480 [Thermoplasmata archaeon]